MQTASLLEPAYHVDAHHELDTVEEVVFLHVIGKGIRAAESYLFGIEGTDDHASFQFALLCQQLTCHLGDTGGAGCVVVGTIVYLAIPYAQVVIVPTNDDVFVFQHGVVAFDDGHEVEITAFAPDFKGHAVFVVVAKKGLQPHVAPLSCDVGSSTLCVETAGHATVEAVGCKGVDMLF